MAIHPSAYVDARAEIDSGADIGPFAVIEGPVRIGAGTRVMAHAVVRCCSSKTTRKSRRSHEKC